MVELYSYKISTSEKIFKVFNSAFLCLISLAFIIPFYMVAASSFVSELEITRRGSFILFPEKFDFSAYMILLRQGSVIFKSYVITTGRVAIGTFLNLLVTSMLAFSLSKKGLPGRNLVLGMIFITMIFSGGLIPGYLVVKSLGLIDSFWSMIFPSLVGTWNLIIMKNYFVTIPESLEESATLDGATPFRILISIILPVSLPMLATIGLFYAIGHWNSWFDASIYINSLEKMPLQVILRNVLMQESDEQLLKNMPRGFYKKPPRETMRSALIVVTTFPIMCVYPFIQKYFIKGVMIGSIKG